MGQLFAAAIYYDGIGESNRAEDCRQHARTVLIKSSEYRTPWGSMTRAELRTLLSEEQNHHCCYCGCEMTEPPTDTSLSRPTDISIEHIIPISHQGPHDWENTAACCFACNNSRPSNVPALIYWEYRLEIQRVRRKRRLRASRAKYYERPRPPRATIELAGMQFQL